jgi:hypothetical protein
LLANAKIRGIGDGVEDYDKNFSVRCDFITVNLINNNCGD